MRCGRTTPEFIFDRMLPAGCMTQARQLAEGLLLAATGFDFRLPELLSGSSRTQCVSPAALSGGLPTASLGGCRPNRPGATRLSGSQLVRLDPWLERVRRSDVERKHSLPQ